MLQRRPIAPCALAGLRAAPAAVAIGALTTAAVPAPRPHPERPPGEGPPRLLERATAVYDLPGEAGDLVPTVAWLTGTRVLVIWVTDLVHVVLVDTTTGSASAQPQLTKAIADVRAGVGGPGVDAFRGFVYASPDGRWLLSSGTSRGATCNHWVAIAADGSRRLLGSAPVTWPYLAWGPDSRRFACVNVEGRELRIDVYSLGTPATLERLDVPHLTRVPRGYPPHLDLLGWCGPDRMVLASSLGIENRTRAAFAAVGVAARNVVERRAPDGTAYREGASTGRAWMIRWPVGMYPDLLSLSPDGRSLAWRVVRHLGWSEWWTQEIWVSDLAGVRFAEVGYVWTSPGAGPDGISDLQWLPGGKRLSFMYGASPRAGTVYTVPVPPQPWVQWVRPLTGDMARFAKKHGIPNDPYSP